MTELPFYIKCSCQVIITNHVRANLIFIRGVNLYNNKPNIYHMHVFVDKLCYHCNTGVTGWMASEREGLTLTSRYAVAYTEMQGEVCVQQRGTILVDNVSGCNAPEMTQSSLFDRGMYQRRQGDSEERK